MLRMNCVYHHNRGGVTCLGVASWRTSQEDLIHDVVHGAVVLPHLPLVQRPQQELPFGTARQAGLQPCSCHEPAVLRSSRRSFVAPHIA